jgi:acetyl esterase/lipase
MVRRVSLAVIALLAALVVINLDWFRAQLRGVAPNQAAASPGKPERAAPQGMSLPGVRKALKSAVEGQRDNTPAPEPPAGVLEKVYYDAPLGKNVAYVTPVKPGARRPAILWIQGGFQWGIDASAWKDAPRGNDQSAAAFRKMGIVEMYPALRGANQNPGHPECFLGEIDDVLAAAELLAKRPDVDPQRLYLGVHSTGGLMVLLAAESTPRFRTVFAFGPVADPRQYGNSGCLPPNTSDAEARPRAPIEFLHEIVTPTFIIEGAQGNADILPLLQKRVDKAPITFLAIPDATHFSVLGPGCGVIAKAILADTGDKPAIRITVEAIQAAMRGH